LISAPISVARAGDDAVEGRDQVFETFLGDQLFDGRLRRLDLGQIGVQGKSACVDVLLGDGIGAGQRLPALGADLRELGIGLGDAQGGARLHELLIEIGRVDFGEHVAGLHLAADVVLPAFQVARDARVDGRTDIGLQAPGQVQARMILHSARRHDGHGRRGLRLGQIMQARVSRCAGDQAVSDDGDGEEREYAADQAQAARYGAAGNLIRLGHGFLRS